MRPKSRRVPDVDSVTVVVRASGRKPPSERGATNRIPLAGSVAALFLVGAVAAIGAPGGQAGIAIDEAANVQAVEVELAADGMVEDVTAVNAAENRPDINGDGAYCFKPPVKLTGPAIIIDNSLPGDGSDPPPSGFSVPRVENAGDCPPGFDEQFDEEGTTAPPAEE